VREEMPKRLLRNFQESDNKHGRSHSAQTCKMVLYCYHVLVVTGSATEKCQFAPEAPRTSSFAANI
jgi:hypothetical protein